MPSFSTPVWTQCMQNSIRSTSSPWSSCKNCMNKMQTLPRGLLALSLLLPLVSPAASCTAQEEASLLQFLDELSPASSSSLTASWRKNGTSCCAWDGVTCNGSGTVTGLLLASRGLEGYISASLVNLTGLLRLNLSHNSLSGGLPMELMSSGSIVVLDVSFNRLDGVLQEFPSSMHHHPLKVLNISNNFFAGEFPSTVWEKKRDLVEINASRNSFSGSIPTYFCISSPSSFAVLDLAYNLFSGDIPTRIGECFALSAQGWLQQCQWGSTRRALQCYLVGTSLVSQKWFARRAQWCTYSQTS